MANALHGPDAVSFDDETFRWFSPNRRSGQASAGRSGRAVSRSDGPAPRDRTFVVIPSPSGDRSAAPAAGTAAAAAADLPREMRSYLAEVLADLARPAPENGHPVGDAEAAAIRIFSLVTSRTFCYLGRKNAGAYREGIVASLRRRMAIGEPLRFFYDIGPGYHATTRPGVMPLRYDVGLSELLIVSQVNALCRRIAEVYPAGARFYLVIDNLCGLRTNDIPLERTEEYVRNLRALIEALRLSDHIRLLVESEEFPLAEYDRQLADIEARPAAAEPSTIAIDNVSRFLGRVCTAAEAAERMERYRRTCTVTDRLIDRLAHEVHMTQRATGATLGFRAFPGGAQRTQTGELVLLRRSPGRLRPLLLTTRNAAAYDCLRLELPDALPPPMTHVVFASPHAPD